MAEVILAEQTFEGFGPDESYGGLYTYDINPAPFTLTLGETYDVSWDGETYRCQVQELSSLVEGSLGLGNLSSFPGCTGNDEPFAVGWSQYGVTLLAFDTEASHTVAIYTAESSEFAPNDIILKRYSGEEKVFKGVDVVRLTHASNEYTVPYTFGEAVENIPITLALKDGDQTVTAPEGTLVKSAVISKPVNLTPENIRSGKTIAGVTGEFVGESEPLIVGTSEGAVALDWSAGDQIITPVTDGKPFSPVTLEKPATLLPENIAEGIDIAGIVGTFAGGGAIKIKCGQIAGNNTTSLTIKHNLLSVPDLFFIYMPSYPYSSLKYLMIAFCISQGLHDLMSDWGNRFGAAMYNASSITSLLYPLETTLSEVQAIHHATDTQITVGFDPSGTANDVYTFSGGTYYWIAIGGLT